MIKLITGAPCGALWTELREAVTCCPPETELAITIETKAEHAERLAEVARLKAEMDAAWEATGVAGAVRGLTDLADVVGTQRRELIEAKSELAEPRFLPRDAMKLLQSMSAELLRRREQVRELQSASGELLERARTAERKHAKAVAVIKDLAQLRGHIKGLQEMYDLSWSAMAHAANVARRWAARWRGSARWYRARLRGCCGAHGAEWNWYGAEPVPAPKGPTTAAAPVLSAACPKCNGAGWLRWDELDHYDGPASDPHNCYSDDTKYPCDACGKTEEEQEG